MTKAQIFDKIQEDLKLLCTRYGIDEVLLIFWDREGIGSIHSGATTDDNSLLTVQDVFTTLAKDTCDRIVKKRLFG